MKKQNSIDAFLYDIEPFFHGRLVSYADVGANCGATFEAVARSELALNRVLLLEANQRVYAKLEKVAAIHTTIPDLRWQNVAVSDVVGSVRIKDMNDMSTFISSFDADESDWGTEPPQDGFFDVEAKPFDDLIEFFPENRVSIMKIDVEGHELAVLKGAKKALSEGRIDVVYIEAALMPGIPGQTYIRDIEDIMASHGYAVFKIYEQVHDWVRDRPILRRVNLAFFSGEMIERYPLSLLQNLAALRADARDAKKASEEQKQYYEKALQDRFAEIAQLTELVSTRSPPSQSQELPAHQTQSRADFTPHRLSPKYSKSHRKAQKVLGLKPKQVSALFCVLIYLLGVATPLIW